MGHVRHLRALVVALSAGVAVLGAGGCAQAGAEPDDAATLEGEISKVEPAAKPGGLPQVKLAPQAVERLGVQVGQVLPQQGGHSVVPYGAVIYAPDGGAFVYTVAGPQTYVRAPVNVVSVLANQAVVDGAPPVGTQVVAIGAAELFGAETGVGDE